MTALITNTIFYIWDNALNAVNNYLGGNGPYKAYFSDDSSDSPSSNIKTLVIEATS